jgi:cytochrome b-561
MEEIGGRSTAMNNFRVLYLITQMIGATIVILIGSWIGVHLGGLTWSAEPKTQFNWHPLLMSFGMIFLYGNCKSETFIFNRQILFVNPILFTAILIYRGFRYARKKSLKLTHATIHIFAFLFTVIALVAVFDSHNLANPPIPNMYSLHSWIGIVAVILFGLQYVCGFMAYLVPGTKEPLKEFYMPYHVYFGLAGFVFAIGAALMGLSEKAFFNM